MVSSFGWCKTTAKVFTPQLNVTVPVLTSPLSFAAKCSFTSPFPVPLDADSNEIQVASFDADQVVFEVMVNVRMDSPLCDSVVVPTRFP